MRSWINSFINLLFPNCCVVCGDNLAVGEEFICTKCNVRMPRTNFHLQKDNEVERRFWGRISIETATSYFYYSKGSDYRRILYELKYHGCKELGEVMGRHMATELFSSGFFQGIDLIIPVPLHRKRRKSRGYNQSEWIALGISNTTGIPMDVCGLVRNLANSTQTRKSVFERWENVQGIFKNQTPQAFSGKHILLVDDVLTTGATLLSCADALSESSDVKISIVTLALA